MRKVPEKITLDGSQASHQAVAELKAEGAAPEATGSGEPTSEPGENEPEQPTEG